MRNPTHWMVTSLALACALVWGGMHSVCGQPSLPTLPSAVDIPPSVSLADLEGLALSQHPALREASARVRAARGKCVQVGLPPNPVIGYQAAEVGNNGSAGQHGIYVAQQFITADKLGLAQQVALREIRQAEQDLEIARLRVLTRVRIAFYRALVGQAAYQTAQNLRKTAEAGLQTATQLEMAMQVSHVDVLQSRIEAESARNSEDRARLELEAARRMLAAAAGSEELGSLELTGSVEQLPMLAWEDAWTRLQSNSPVLAQAHLAVERARWDVAQQVAGRTPNVNVQASVWGDDGTGHAIAGVQVGVPLPVLNRNQGNIRRARADLTAAREAVTRIQLQLRAKLAGVYPQFATASVQAVRYRDSMLPDARRALDLVTVAYRNGDVDYGRLLMAQQAFFRANLAYLDTLRDVWTNYSVMEGLLTASATN